MMLFHTVITLFTLHALMPGFGYRFSCIEFQGKSCDCDTDYDLIDCNGRGWNKFPKLTSRLRGYSVMTLAFNEISGPLPAEADVLEKLPNLKLLDLTGNNKLSCYEILRKFDRVTVDSHCTKEEMLKFHSAASFSIPSPTLQAYIQSRRRRPSPVPRNPPPGVPSRSMSSLLFPNWPMTRPLTTMPVTPCVSLWCHLENEVADAYSTAYLDAHYIWMKMKNEFLAQQENMRKTLFSILE